MIKGFQMIKIHLNQLSYFHDYILKIDTIFQARRGKLQTLMMEVTLVTMKVTLILFWNLVTTTKKT